jgi:hypothetical protein
MVTLSFRRLPIHNHTHEGGTVSYSLTFTHTHQLQLRDQFLQVFKDAAYDIPDNTRLIEHMIPYVTFHLDLDLTDSVDSLKNSRQPRHSLS